MTARLPPYYSYAMATQPTSLKLDPELKAAARASGYSYATLIREGLEKVTGGAPGGYDAATELRQGIGYLKRQVQELQDQITELRDWRARTHPENSTGEGQNAD